MGTGRCTGWIPDYPEDVVGYTYSTGTLFIFMGDLAERLPAGQSPGRPWSGWRASTAWSAEQLDGELATKIVDGIKQAFVQSPYIYRVNP